jgi:predicted DNA-binding protein
VKKSHFGRTHTWLDRTAMLEVKLTPELDTALSREARRARRSKAALVLNAVEQYLQDVDDHQAVLASRKHRGRTATLDQLKQRLGMGG